MVHSGEAGGSVCGEGRTPERERSLGVLEEKEACVCGCVCWRGFPFCSPASCLQSACQLSQTCDQLISLRYFYPGPWTIPGQVAILTTGYSYTSRPTQYIPSYLVSLCFLLVACTSCVPGSSLTCLSSCSSCLPAIYSLLEMLLPHPLLMPAQQASFLPTSKRFPVISLSSLFSVTKKTLLLPPTPCPCPFESHLLSEQLWHCCVVGNIHLSQTKFSKKSKMHYYELDFAAKVANEANWTQTLGR